MCLHTYLRVCVRCSRPQLTQDKLPDPFAPRATADGVPVLLRASDAQTNKKTKIMRRAGRSRPSRCASRRGRERASQRFASAHDRTRARARAHSRRQPRTRKDLRRTFCFCGCVFVLPRASSLKRSIAGLASSWLALRQHRRQSLRARSERAVRLARNATNKRRTCGAFRRSAIMLKTNACSHRDRNRER